MKGKLPLPSVPDIKKVLTFKGRKLPSFPQAAFKLLEISGDDTVSLADITKVIESDPGIAVRVLELVNSAVYGLQRKITALPDAIVLLGVDEIKKLAIGITVFHGLFSFDRTKHFDRIHFWRHSLAVAILALEIAKYTKYSRPEEAYIAGLLHDVGKIFLDIQCHKNYGEFLHETAGGQENMVEQERRSLGLGHDDIGAFFCSLWKLPENILLPVKYHHQRFNPRELSREEAMLISIVSLSNFVCWTQGMGSFNMVSSPVLAPEIETFIELEKIDIINRIKLMNQEMERISEFYQFVFPTPNQIHDNLLWMSFQLSRANTRYFYQAPAPDLRRLTPAHVEHNLSGPAFEFGRNLAKAKTIKEVLEALMFQMGCLFEPRHWSVLLKDPKSEALVFSVVGGTLKGKLQGMMLSGKQGLAAYILEQKTPLVIEAIAAESPLRNYLEPYADLEATSCMGLPFKTDNRTFGAIELIDTIKRESFTAEDLKMLVLLAEHAALAIERIHLNKALQKMATTDSLTGLKNRYSLERILCNREGMLREYGSEAAIMIIDIDKFKQINETSGRQAADRMLKRVAEVLRSTFRLKDDIFRYEGDKFIVLLSGSDKEAALKAKQRVLNVFKALHSTMGVTISIFVHTVQAEKAQSLIPFIEERLARDKARARQKIENESLQPFLEQELMPLKPEKEKVYRKKVSLDGQFIQIGTKTHGLLRVKGLSMLEAGFMVLSDHEIHPGSFLDISFHLDDAKWSLIERRVIIKNVTGNHVDAEFYNPPPYSPDLGFYLLS